MTVEAGVDKAEVVAVEMGTETATSVAAAEGVSTEATEELPISWRRSGVVEEAKAEEASTPSAAVARENAEVSLASRSGSSSSSPLK